jgi:membrane protease YdiL (CAAX protease family)
LACGFASLSALLFVLWKLGLLVWDGQVLHGPEIWTYAFGWGLVFLLDAFFEESLLRGYLQFTLTRGIGFWWGAALLSLFFGVAHGSNPGETPVGFFSVAAFAFLFFLRLWYEGSLWWAVGCHAGLHLAQSCFYGTSHSGITMQGHLFAEHPTGSRLLSGGSTAPEGSLFIFPLLATMSLLIILWWSRKGPSPLQSKASHAEPHTSRLRPS